MVWIQNNQNNYTNIKLNSYKVERAKDNDLLNLIDKDQADNEIIDELIEHQLKENINSYKFFIKISFSIKTTIYKLKTS